MADSNSFIKNFSILFTGNALSQVIPFLFAPILARIFSPEEFAVHGNFVAIVSAIAIIAGGRYEFAVILPKSNKKAANIIALAFKIAIIVGILSFVLIFLDEQISNLYQDNQLSDYIPYVSLGVVLVAFNSIITQWLIRNKKYKSISITKIFQSLTLNGFTILLGILGYGIGGLIFGWCLGFLSALIILFFPFKKSFNFSLIEKTEMKSVAKEYKDFPIINSSHAFTDIFFSQFLLFTIITREFGLVYLGLFFIMNKYLRAPIRLIGSAVGQIYYREANENYIKNLSVYMILLQSLKMVAFFAVPMMVIVFFFAPFIFKIYLGSDWVKSGEYAQIMALPILINFLASPISSTPLIYRKQKKAYIISIIGYTCSIAAIYYSIWMDWDFKRMLILFSSVMSCYYLYLLVWYISLARSNK